MISGSNFQSICILCPNYNFIKHLPWDRYRISNIGPEVPGTQGQHFGLFSKIWASLGPLFLVSLHLFTCVCIWPSQICWKTLFLLEYVIMCWTNQVPYKSAQVFIGCDDDDDNDYIWYYIWEAFKKKYGIIWEFFPNVGPPPPPFGNASFKMKFFG